MSCPPHSVHIIAVPSQRQTSLVLSQALFVLHRTCPNILGYFHAEPNCALVYQPYLHDLLLVLEALVNSTDDIVSRYFSQAQVEYSSAFHSAGYQRVYTAVPSPSTVPYRNLVGAACATYVPASRSPSYSSVSSGEPPPPPYSPSTQPVATGAYLNPPTITLSGSSSSSDQGIFPWAHGPAAAVATDGRDQAPTPYPSPATD